MTIPAAYAISADSLTAETFRQAPSSLLASTGVVASGDLAVTQNSTPNMSVDVAAGQIWIPGTLASTTGFSTNVGNQAGYGLPTTFNEQGCYYGWNNGTVNLQIAAADPTNPRIDLVVAYIQDAAYSGSTNQPTLGVVTGTPGSGFAPPAPASAVALAQVSVAAGATSITTADIFDQRPFADVGPGRSGRVLAWAQLTAGFSTSSATYVDVGTGAALTFLAPRSGDVLLTMSGQMNNGAAGVQGVFQWSTTSGSVPAFYSGDIDNTHAIAAAVVLTGLTEGASVTATLQWAYTSVAGTITLGGSTRSPTVLLAQGI